MKSDFERDCERISHTNAIALYISGGQWHAQHLGPYAREVRELFGTTVLPTPFSHICPAEDVLEEIQALNPRTVVYLMPASADYPPGCRVTREGA